MPLTDLIYVDKNLLGTQSATGVSICMPVRVFINLNRTEVHRDPCQLRQTATT